MITIINKLLFRAILLSLTASLTISCGQSPFQPKGDGETGQRVIQTSEGEQLAFPKSQYTVNGFWRVGPKVFEESSMLIIIQDKDGRPVALSEELKMKLWMPGMGHGSYPVKITSVSDGVYEATEIFFTMGGLWDIHFQLFKDGSLKEEVKWPLNL